jgi:nucleoside-diphosphate-sugar epimerase
LLSAGHDVRLLVRHPDRVETALAPFGVHVEDVVTGNVLDAGSVDRALPGCDAVINAAAVFSLDPRRAQAGVDKNPRATEIVLSAARRAGLDPIVHVSSYVALLPSRTPVGPESPVGEGGPAYPRSKAESERIARRHQAEGAPVVTAYPGAVAGPDDPYVGDTAFMLENVLKNRLPFAVPGGWPIADVRYVAAGLAAMIEPGRGPRRYFLGGHYTAWNELYSLLRKLTGRRLPAVPMPGFAALASGRALDALQPTIPVRLPFGYQGSWVITNCRGSDDTMTREEFGLQPPPVEETLGDTIRWMVRAGHIPRRVAGKLASA